MVLKPRTYEISIKDIETAHIIGTGTHRGITTTTSEIFCQQATQCTAMTNFRLYSYLLSSTVPVTNANMTTILVCQHPILHSVLTQKVDHPPTGYYVLLRCRKLFTRGMSLPTLLDDHAEHDTGGKAEDNRQTLTDNLNIDDPLETSWEDIFTVLQVCLHDTANFIENLLQATTSYITTAFQVP